MAWSLKQELTRKAIHLLMVIVVGLYIFAEHHHGKQTALVFLVMVLLVLLLMDYLRLEHGIRIPVLWHVTRAKEENRMHSATHFVCAAIICFGVFDFPIALAAMFMAIFGDFAAAVIGHLYGHTLIYNKKTFAGAAAELTVNLIVGVTLLLGQLSIYSILLLAFVATLAETVLDTLDDNLVVPVVTRFLGQMLL